MEAQRRGLGKGLSSLISNPVKLEPVPSVTKTEIREEKNGYRVIPISQISPNRDQPRKYFDDEKISELAHSIRGKGILQPIIVSKKNGRYEIISGERRYRASLQAGLTEIPAIIKEVGEQETLELALIENIQREDLDVIEEAMGYDELMEKFGYTQEQVAQKIGKERTTIANTLRLLKLPQAIRVMLQSGQISEGHARALLGVPEIEKQLYFAEQIIKEGWSVRELEARLKARKSGGEKKGHLHHGAGLSPSLVHILDELRRRLGTQIKLVPSGKKGNIVIEYYSDSDLDRIYNTLTNQN
ncbi:MAG: ParB/RepB/Spo0J family partition protein [Deltaproteobacteria bacterium]|nr:MAG: ParB/RepB/Spo0J family partition protein [Deltaproteobacteria bacterium]